VTLKSSLGDAQLPVPTFKMLAPFAATTVRSAADPFLYAINTTGGSLVFAQPEAEEFASGTVSGRTHHPRPQAVTESPETYNNEQVADRNAYDRKWPLDEGQIPNVRGVRVALGTRASIVSREIGGHRVTAS
jgi:hypothetical protein